MEVINFRITPFYGKVSMGQLFQRTFSLTITARPNQVVSWIGGRHLQIDGIRTMLLSFGWGDGGGGPTRDHLEFLSRAKNLEGLPKVKHASINGLH